MNLLVLIFACFSLLGILDYITGNHLKLGQEFEKGIQLAGMLGMLCMVPVISSVLSPIVIPLCERLQLDPSVFAGLLFANDTGGAPLARELAFDPAMGLYNGLVVGSMMGVTLTFTIPVALKVIPEAHHKDALLGILCGICTIPVGCIAAGLIIGIPLLQILLNLIPVLLLSGIIVFGLIKAPRIAVRVITVFGKLITVLIMVGLGAGIFQFLTGYTLIPGILPVEESFSLLFQLVFMLSGVFPFIKVLSLLLKRPLLIVSNRLKINNTAALGLLTTLANSAPMLDMVKDMNRKGIVMNLAFAVSAAFSLGDHLAYTLMFEGSYTLPVVLGKLLSGAAALTVATIVCRGTDSADVPAEQRSP